MTAEPAAGGVDRPRFLALEGLRGALALLVCCGHLGLNTVAGHIGASVQFGRAVDVFFALSGFVLCHTNYFGRRTLASFAIGRLARLYPLHVVAMALMAVASQAIGVWEAPWVVAQQLALAHNLGPQAPYTLNFPNWSISVECWVSLLFFVILRRRAHRAVLLALLVAAPVLGIPGLLQDDAQTSAGWVNLGMARGVAGFATGALAYLLFERVRQRAVVPWPVGAAAVAGLAIFFLLPGWSRPLSAVFYATIAIALVALASNGRTLLACAPMVFLGRISYSIYLLHIPIYALLTLAFGEAVVRGGGKGGVIAAVLVASAASWRWIERPAQRRILRRGNAFLAGGACRADALLNATATPATALPPPQAPDP